MKVKEKGLAIEYRKNGSSINQIAKKLKVSKASVSLWVRKIKISVNFLKALSERGSQIEVIEKRRETRLRNENNRRQIIIDKAKRDIDKISAKELLLIGAMLYWAEGSKTRRGVVEFSNGDPLMIRLMMKFFRKLCNVQEDKFRGYIHIHPHLDSKQAEAYWSNVSQIPLRQFYKTYKNKNKSSKNKKDSLPYGTFGIYVCNTELFLKIKGWTEKIVSLTNSEKLL